jgi:hypothetical protein
LNDADCDRDTLLCYLERKGRFHATKCSKVCRKYKNYRISF